MNTPSPQQQTPQQQPQVQQQQQQRQKLMQLPQQQQQQMLAQQQQLRQSAMQGLGQVNFQAVYFALTEYIVHLTLNIGSSTLYIWF